MSDKNIAKIAMCITTFLFLFCMILYFNGPPHNLEPEKTNKTEHVCANEFYFGINLIRVLPKPGYEDSLRDDFAHSNRSLISGICDENFNFKIDNLEKYCSYKITSNYKTVCFDRIEGE